MVSWKFVNFCLAVGGICFCCTRSWYICLGGMSRIGTKSPFSILTVGILVVGSTTGTSLGALNRERQSAGIELMILIRKNLCSGSMRGLVPCA